MGKKIIITSGPTNERIDSVMKITNMSTGALGSTIASVFLTQPEFAEKVDTIFYISTKMTHKPVVPDDQLDKIIPIQIESTQDIIDALKDVFEHNKIDLMIHSAAVGDYKAKYSIRGEALAENIVDALLDMPTSNRREVYDRIISVLDNPKSLQDDSTKMSSYEPRLMTMLTLTPKVIGLVKQMSPDTKLVGFKLLDGVTKEHLFEVANNLRKKNNADYIVANDLSKIGHGKHWAMIIGESGIVAECETKYKIAETLADLTL